MKDWQGNRNSIFKNLKVTIVYDLADQFEVERFISHASG